MIAARQLSILLFFWFLGSLLQKLGVPIPSTILGLLLLLLALLWQWVPLKEVSACGEFLLRHLAIFFIPAGVGLIDISGEVRSQLFVFISICIVTTWIVMGVTGRLVEWLIIRQESQEKSRPR